MSKMYLNAIFVCNGTGTIVTFILGARLREDFKSTCFKNKGRGGKPVRP